MSPSSPVRATLNYSLDNGRPPDYYFYEPDPAVELNPPGTDPHEVAIHDGWPEVDRLSLDREGFVLRSFPARTAPHRRSRPPPRARRARRA